MAHTTSGSEGENLSRIKDILFGEDLQSIEQKLGDFKDESSSAFEKLKAELESRFRKIEILLAEKSKETEKTQEKTLKIQSDVSNELKKEIVAISLKINNEKVNIEKTINSNIEEVNNKITHLENILAQAIDKLKEDYDTRLNDLSNSKINKSTLADILAELAEKLNS